MACRNKVCFCTGACKDETKSYTFENLLRMKKALDDADVPRDNRIIYTDPVGISRALGLPLEEVIRRLEENQNDIKPSTNGKAKHK